MRSRIPLFVLAVGFLFATVTCAGGKEKAEKHFKDGETYFRSPSVRPAIFRR